MPNLPDKTALGQPSFDPNRPLVQVSMGMADPGAEALAAFGGSIKKIGATIKAKADEADNYEVQKALVDFDLAQEKRLDDSKRTAAPEAKGFTDGYRGSYDNDARKFMAGVPAHMRPKVDEILVRRGASYEKRAYDFELQERDRYHVDDVNKTLEDIYNDSTARPDAYAANGERGISIIKGSRLTERAKAKALPEFLNRNQEAAILALRDKYRAEGRDINELVDQVRKAPRGSWQTPGTPGQLPGSGAAGGDVIDLIKKFEGDKDNGWDVSQFSGPYGVKRGKDEQLTLPEAEARLRDEVASVQKDMDTKIKTPLTENQRAALTSLFYNIGTGKGRLDQVAKMIDAGEADKVPAWIRQYDKADGKTLNGLQSRRAEEASLFQRSSGLAASGASTGDDKVERTDLPPPGPSGPALPEKRAPKIDPETGQPIRDIGADQSDMPKAPPGEVAPYDKNYEPVESDDVPFGHLTYKNRRRLLNVLAADARSHVTTEITNEIERIRLGRPPSADAKGQTVIDRARGIMPPVQFRKLNEAWQEARLEYEAISPLSRMTREEQEDHVVGVFRRAEGNEESLRVARKVRDKAERDMERMTKLRGNDPVRAIEGYIGEETDERRVALPNTREAYRKAAEARRSVQGTMVTEDGTRVPSPADKRTRMLSQHQEYELIFDARLKDQQAIMPDDPSKHRIISKREAERLLRIDDGGKKLDYNTFKQKMTEAADRAEQWYGPKYAHRAMDEAINFIITGKEHNEAADKLISKMARGEPILFDDLRRVHALDHLKRTDLNFGGNTMGGLNFGGRNAMGSLDRIGRGVEFPTTPSGPAIGNRPTVTNWSEARPIEQPSERHVEWVRANPGGWQAFDEKFGPGAASRALGAGDNPWGDRRKAVPKAKAGSPEDRAAAATKPKARGWW